MTSRRCLAALAASIFACVGFAAADVTFEWATVGDPGNPPDNTGQGSVGYVFAISKHEVTNAQWVECLNKVDPAGNLGLWVGSMQSFNASGGIQRDFGAPLGSQFSVKPGRGNQPVVFVKWTAAARFVNWLHNGQPTGEGVGTETGVYDMSQPYPSRLPGATYFIPNVDEWYKASYYDPAKPGGPGYWDYATRSDTAPNSDNPASLDFANNSANFRADDGIANGYDDGFAVTGTPLYNAAINHMTDVGAYTQSISSYGTFDQAGNVAEWNETLYDGAFRGIRGGGWNGTSIDMRPAVSTVGNQAFDGVNLGFRVARPALPVCPADFNNSGAASVQDIFDFLAAYFANDPTADFNQSGALSVQDLFDFLAAYFAGCP